MPQDAFQGRLAAQAEMLCIALDCIGCAGNLRVLRARLACQERTIAMQVVGCDPRQLP
jgi:hypothetical protein